MARPSILSVSDELRERFAAAVKSDDVRCLRAIIDNETIRLADDPTLPASDSVSEDFEVLSAELDEKKPMFFLFNCGEKRWVLICFVSDNCHVRQKMLYSASHKDLVETLGRTRFKGEYYCNSIGDFRFEDLMSSLDAKLAPPPLTDAEKVKLAERLEAGQAKSSSSGMAVMPFQLSAPLKEALNSLAAGEINFVDVKVTPAETIELSKKASLTDPDELPGHFNTDEGRFYCIRFPLDSGKGGSLFFIFSCPEHVAIKEKMVLATVKSSVLAGCKESGLVFLKTLEVQTAKNIVEDLKYEIGFANADRSLKNEQKFSKPRGPGGRGRRRMMKKKK